MKRPNNQSGFGLLYVVLIIVAVVALGGGGWLVYKHDHKTNPATTSNSQTTTKSQNKKTGTTSSGSNSQSSSNSSTSHQAANTFNIPELSATMTLPSGLSSTDLKYVITTNTGTQVANFTTTSLENADGSDNCNGSNGGIGSIWRTTQSEGSGGDVSKQVGQYYYNFEEPQQPCSASQSADQLETSQIAELKQAFETITTSN